MCYSRIDVESDELALVVGLFLRLFRQYLRTNSKFLQIKSPSIGPVTPVQTDAKIDMFVTPVSIMTYTPITWKMTWENLKEANDFEVAVVQEGTSPQERAPGFWDG